MCLIKAWQILCLLGQISGISKFFDIAGQIRQIKQKISPVEDTVLMDESV
jgi:hypothetical protein